MKPNKALLLTAFPSLLVLIFIFSFKNPVAENTSEKAFAVVELFTSEGCASCLAADELVSQMEKEADENGTEVYFLNMHVSYWDYLGWKDMYASKKFEARQDFYSSYLPGGKSYTPQIVVNGTVEFIGSDAALYSQNTRDMLQHKKAKLINSIAALKIDSTAALIKYNLAELPINCSLHFALVEKKLPVSNIKSGENKGQKIKHYSAVRLLESVANPKTSGEFKMNYAFKKTDKNFSIIAFIQDNEARDILSVSKVALK